MKIINTLSFRPIAKGIVELRETLGLYGWAIAKGIVGFLATLVLYELFHVGYIRSNFEDFAFDQLNWFVLSAREENVNAPKTIIMLVDDQYLQSKNLLDENNETTYGYMFPREYLANIIANLDNAVADLDEENYPKALFLDYDLSYFNDPLNLNASKGDKLFLETLKKDRPYTIYLLMNANHNFVYRSKDKTIQELIRNQKIKFASGELATAGDDVTRRYSPYKTFKDINNKEKIFENISVALWKDYIGEKIDVNSTFSLDKFSLIENRIIFKNTRVIESGKYMRWQSEWKQLEGMSSNYPLHTVFDEDLVKDAVIMIGPSHQHSQDNYNINKFGKKMVGVEMHANALMTLHYINGNLKRLPVFEAGAIVAIVIILSNIFLVCIFLVYIFLINVCTRFVRGKTHVMHKNKARYFKLVKIFLKKKIKDFQDKWDILVSVLVFLAISLCLLHYSQLWFNWMIVSFSTSLVLISTSLYLIVRKILKIICECIR